MTTQPSTVVHLLKGVPLDNSYTNTIAFSTSTEQYNYFYEKKVFTEDEQTYQRVSNNELKVKKPIDTIYNCNYLIFDNVNFEDKRYYAFITKVEYVNNNTTKIEYEIDVLQTWLFDINILDSYVERETPSSDGYNNHNLLEPLSFSDTQYEIQEITPNTGAENLSNRFAYVVALSRSLVADKDAIGAPHPIIVSGCPCALELYICSDLHAVKNLIYPDDGYGQIVEDYSNLVTFITTVPWLFWTKIVQNEPDVSTSKLIFQNTDVFTQYIVFNANKIRKNRHNTTWNRVLKYPYQSLIVMLGEQIIELAPQNFYGTGDAEFSITYSFSATPTIVLHPINYSNRNIYIEGTLPSVPWTDTIFAQKTASDNSIRANMIFSALSGQSLQGIAMSGANAMYQQAQSNFAYAHTAPATHGFSNDNSALVTNRLMPRFYLKTLKNDVAKSLDAYFSKFGYSTNRLKKFSKTSMKNYKYVKTINCSVSGNMSADTIAKIQSIHDTGITYWKAGTTIGQY